MICKELERYDTGELSEAEFNRHATRCPACREALFLDKKVMSLAKAPPHPIDGSRLWSRIESSLEQEMLQTDRSRKGFFRYWKVWPVARAAVIILIAVGFGLYLGLKNRSSSSGLLAQKALAKVEQREREYVQAIQELEKQALPQMADMDLDLEFLYRERLETIDAQIAMCREALAMNPANAHIRRYMIAALQDKKETLISILDVKTEKPKSRRSI